MPNANDDMFYVWRAMIALAYIDHKLDNHEIAFLEENIHNRDFTDKQRKQLNDDIEFGVNLEDVIGEIADVRKMAHLINFARVLFYKDGEFCDIESRILDQIHDSHIAKINLDEKLEEANNYALKALNNEELKENIIAEDDGLLDKLARYIGKFL